MSGRAARRGRGPGRGQHRRRDAGDGVDQPRRRRDDYRRPATRRGADRPADDDVRDQRCRDRDLPAAWPDPLPDPDRPSAGLRRRSGIRQREPDRLNRWRGGRSDHRRGPLRPLACWLAGLLACWLAGLLACWLAGLLACWLAGLLACWLAGLLACWLAGLLACWLAGLLACWLAGLLACWLAGLLACWLAGLLACWLAGLLACWLAGLLACWLAGLLACWLAGLLACWLAGLLACWLAGLLACWLAGLLACWLAGLLACWLAGLLACWLAGWSALAGPLLVTLLLVVGSGVSVDAGRRPIIRSRCVGGDRPPRTPSPTGETVSAIERSDRNPSDPEHQRRCGVWRGAARQRSKASAARAMSRQVGPPPRPVPKGDRGSRKPDFRRGNALRMTDDGPRHSCPARCPFRLDKPNGVATPCRRRAPAGRPAAGARPARGR